ncbi:MAG: hypothetical protein IJZ08_05120 [Clostridia bacterium]|nr:hypothetical protein [Clostridia bacterium]
MNIDRVMTVLRKSMDYIGMFLCFFLLMQFPLYYAARMMASERTLTEYVQGGAALLLLCMALHSFVRTSVLFDTGLRERYEALSAPPVHLWGRIGYFLRRPSFWIETAAAVLLFWILPLPSITADLSLPPKWIVFAVFFPTFFFINVRARLSAMKRWQRTAEAPQREKLYTKKARDKQMFIAATVYGAGGIVVPVILPVLIAWLFGGAYLAFLFFKKVWVLLVAVVLFILWRAYRKRRSFLCDLQRICKEKRYTLSPVRHPYLSAIRFAEGESFSVQTPKGRYSCKLIGGVRRLVPMILQANGEGCFVHALKMRGYEILRHESVFTFGYTSEDKKILIVSPVPKKVILRDRGRTHTMDNGDYVGDFRMYTATAFLNALEREVLDR